MADKRGRALVKNTFILSLGSFLPRITSIVTLPILTGYLTKNEYGTVDLVTTLVSFLLPLATLQMQMACFRFLVGKRDNKEYCDSIATNVLMFTLCTSVVVLCIAYFFLQSLGKIVGICIVVYLFIDIINVTFQQIARGLGLNFCYSISCICNSFIYMIAVVIFIRGIRYGLIGALLSYIIGASCAAIFLFFRLKIYQKIKLSSISWSIIKELLRYSIPLVPNSLSNWVLLLSDRLVITGFLGVEANAVYAVANKIPNVLKSLQSTFLYAWQENASLSVEDPDSDEYYTMMFDTVLRFTAGLMALMIAITPIAFAILIQGDYDEAYIQMPILYMGILYSCLASYLGGIYTAHMKSSSLGISTIIAAIFNLIIDLLLVNSFGIFCGSISTFVSFLLLTIYRMRDVQKFQHINYNIKNIITFSIILSVLGFLSARRTFIVDLFVFAIAIVFAAFVNRKMLNSIIEICKNRLMKVRKK